MKCKNTFDSLPFCIQTFEKFTCYFKSSLPITTIFLTFLPNSKTFGILEPFSKILTFCELFSLHGKHFEIFLESYKTVLLSSTEIRKRKQWIVCLTSGVLRSFKADREGEIGLLKWCIHSTEVKTHIWNRPCIHLLSKIQKQS